MTKQERWIVILLVIITVEVIIGTVLLFKAEKATENVYTMECEVTEIEDDTLVMVDNEFGNIWAWDGVDGFSVGDTVQLTMDSQGTDTVIDDVILAIRELAD